MRRLVFLTVILIILFWGCSLDYKAGGESEKLEEQIPDTILINFKHVIVENNKKVFQIEAEEALIFNKNKVTLLKGIHFLEYDKTGNIITEGKAENARFHTDTENAEIWGSVYCYSVKEGAEIYTPSLSWEKETRILKAEPGDLVRINKDDGSFVQGRGFMADLRRKSLSYLSQVLGEIIREDEEK